jgi:hypothetical protein
MNVSQLRELLSKVPQDLPVYIAYDSMVCVEEIENDDNNMIVEDGEDRGVYLCSQSARIDWAMDPENKITDYHGGKFLCQYSIPTANP